MIVRKWFILGGMLGGTVIALVGTAASGHLAAMAAGAAIWSLACASTNVWSLTQAVAGRSQTGTASGAQNFVGSVGGIVAPIVTGLIVQTTGTFAPAFLFAGILLLAGVAAGHVLINDPKDDARLTAARAADEPS